MLAKALSLMSDLHQTPCCDFPALTLAYVGEEKETRKTYWGDCVNYMITGSHTIHNIYVYIEA